MTTTLTPTQIRKEAAAYLTGLAGAGPLDSHWWIPIDGGNQHSICVGFSVYGRTRTAYIGVDRWRGVTLPRDDIEARWLETHIEPYSMQWLYWKNSRTESNTMPSAGICAYTKVKADDALEVLHMWIPQEIQWQREIRDLFAERGEPTLPFRVSNIGDKRPPRAP